MQRPWGGAVSALFEGQQGGLGGWSIGMRLEWEEVWAGRVGSRAYRAFGPWGGLGTLF